MDTPLDVNLNMVDLNGKAVMALCQLTVPYMPSGSQIINIASVAAFQPIPYINVYGDKGTCAALQPRSEPGAEKERHPRDGGLPVLDKNRVL